jgi:hypothetical protein
MAALSITAGGTRFRGLHGMVQYFPGSGIQQGPFDIGAT